MNVGLSWETFLLNAEQIEAMSSEIGDDWKILGDKISPSSAYLQYKRIQKERNTILKWEYHVCYNLSYSVPTLYFNVWNECGNLLPLDEIWKYSHPQFRSDRLEEMYSVITQQEHQILCRPYFAIHPCKTHEFLLNSEGHLNILVKYITSVGPLINLQMDNSYGKLS